MAPGWGTLIGMFKNDDPFGADCEGSTERTAEFVSEMINHQAGALVHNCYCLKVEATPVRTEHGVGMTVLRQLLPLANLSGAGQLLTQITGVIFFADMSPEDRAQHQQMVLSLEEQLATARVAASGIVLPGGAGGLGHS